ncbi:MAG: aldose 1-epimerase family protein [Oscillospiraceae bacterium]
MLFELTNNKLYITINSLGAELMSLCDVSANEYLWQGNPEYWKGHSPVLFPIVGALRNNKTHINGKEYTMPRHGLARTNEFKLLKRFTDRAIFSLCSNEETKKSYPFDFELQVEYSLHDTTMTVTFTVINHGETVMPFGIGAHPGFRVPLSDDERFEDYKIVFAQKETCDTPLLDASTSLINPNNRKTVLENQDTINLTHDLFYNDALIPEQLKSRKVTLFSGVSGNGLQMEFGDFDYFGIWQSPDAPFICLEPWTSTATLSTEDDVFENKRGIIFLKPSEEKEFSYKITLL